MSGTLLCSNLAQLQRLAAGALPEPERESLLVHLESCPTCAHRLSSLPERDPLAGLLRQAWSFKDNTASGLAFERLLARLQKLGPGMPSIAVQPITFTCQHCKKTLRVKCDLAGKRVKCPACQQVIAVPSQVDEPSPTPPGSVNLQTGAQTQNFVPQPMIAASLTPQLSTQGGASAADGDTHHTETRDRRQELLAILAPAQAADELGRLGPYRVLQVLGAGGMGVVYKAEDPQLKRLVALKAMLPALAVSESARQRFLREARTVAAIKHDHIVSIYQVAEERGVPFLAMEFLEGESLDVRLQREGALPITEVLRIGRELAEGLQAAHERGLIHRDIKPPNIWLEGTDSGAAGRKTRVKILDFGLARGSSEEILTQQGAIMGTPGYMAPEQAQGRQVDLRCDLFSLGCVLYHLCTGTMPFTGTDAISMILAVVTQTPLLPHTINPQVPEALSALIVRLMAKDPQERPASAQEVADALAACHAQVQQTPAAVKSLPSGSQGGVTAETHVPREEGVQPLTTAASLTSKSRRYLVALAAAFLVGILLLAGGIFRIATDQGELEIKAVDQNVQVIVSQGGKQVELVDLKTKQKVKLPSGPYELKLGEGRDDLVLVTDRIQIKRRDQVIAEVTWKPRPQPSAKVLAQKPEVKREPRLVPLHETRELKGHSSTVTTTAFSPDGKRIASAGGPIVYKVGQTADWGIRIWDVQSCQEIACLTEHENSVRGVQFVPGKEQLLSCGRDGQIILWDLEKKKVVERTAPSDRYWGLDVSPDGSRAVVAGGSSLVLDLPGFKKTLAPRRLADPCLTAAWAPKGTLALIAGGWSPKGRNPGKGDYRILVWNTTTGDVIAQLKGHTESVSSAVFLHDGKRVISGGGDLVLRVWDLAQKQELFQLTGHEGTVTRLAVSPDDRFVASAGSDGSVRLWDLESRRERYRLQDHVGSVHALAWSPTGKHIVYGGRDGLRLWPVPQDCWPGQARAAADQLPAETQFVPLTGTRSFKSGVAARKISFSFDGRRLVTTGPDDAEKKDADPADVHVWDVETGSQLTRLQAHQGKAQEACFVPGQDQLVSTGNQQIILWDLSRREILYRTVMNTIIWQLVVSPDGSYLLAATAGADPMLLQLPGLKGRSRPQDLANPLLSVGWSPRGDLAVAGEGRKESRMYVCEAATGKVLGHLVGHTGGVSRVRFFPDGKRIISSASDRTLRVWDIALHKELFRLSGHTDEAYDVSLSPDARFAVSAGWDGSVRVWHLEERRELYRLDQHLGGPVSTVSWSPTGRHIAFGGPTKGFRIWDVPPACWPQK